MATLSVIRKNDADAAGVAQSRATVYDSVGVLPLSGNIQGEQAFIPGDSSTDLMYIWDGGGWYKMALIQTVPSFTTGPDASYELASDGVTTTVITLVATDAEGIPVTFSATTDIGFDSIGTVSQDSSVFTVTPFSEDSAGTATSGTITFKASDGISIASALSTFNLNFRIENSNFTRMLIKAAGNNGTNTDINDASSSSHTVTTAASVTAQSFSPHHPGGYSTEFDGYMSVPSHADFGFGTGDFTIEFWHYPLTVATASVIDYRTGSNGNQPVPIIWFNGNGYYYYYVNGSTRISGNTGDVKANQWYHVAISRVSGSTKMFVNGQQAGNTYNDSSISYNQGGAFVIGRRYMNAGSGWFYLDGYLRDVRVIKGTGLYTTSFDPPRDALTAISNTKLLLCGLPYHKDQSTSNRTVTTVGDIDPKRFSPYDHLAYSVSTHGASVYFDGQTGSRLSVPSSSDFNFGTSDWTIDFWWYPKTVGSSKRSLVDLRTTGTQNVPVIWQHENSYIYYYFAGAFRITGTNNTIKANRWHHIAVSRVSNNTRMFINGVQDGSTYSDSNTYVQGSDFFFGRNTNFSAADYNPTGYVSDLRVINGTGLYSSNFTPPTAPVTAVTNTKLLTCNDTPNIFDGAGKNSNLTLGGTAKSSTAYTKNASASMLFDGNSDYVELSNYDEYAPGTNNFYVEFWMRYTGGSGTRNIIDNRGQANGYAIRLDSSHRITVYSEPSSSTKHTSAALTQDQWYHVAFVRNSANSYLFIDGTQSGSAVTNADNYTSTSMVIGAQHAKNQQYFGGYVEDVRIGQGINRYPFVPAKETLSATADTVLLIGHDGALTNDGSAGGTATASGSAAVSDFGPAGGMKSIYFDGGSDYLTLGSNSAYAIGSSDNFSIECWVYFHDFPTGHSPILQWSTTSLGSSVANGTAFYGISSGTSGYGSISFQKHGVSDPFVTYANPNTHTIAEKEWIHLHVQRSGTTAKGFVNGMLTQTTTSSSWTATQNGLYIGARHSPNYINGYISNLRFIKGSGAIIRSGDFTPPTSSLRG